MAAAETTATYPGPWSRSWPLSGQRGDLAMDDAVAIAEEEAMTIEVMAAAAVGDAMTIVGDDNAAAAATTQYQESGTRWQTRQRASFAFCPI